MTPVIRVDDDVMSKLKEQAVALNLVFSTPNEVLRSILGLDTKEDADMPIGIKEDDSLIEIIVGRIYTSRRWALIPVPMDKRSFFPGYKVNFDIETDCGVFTTHITSAPRGTPYGDPRGGAYIQSNLRPWFDNHPGLKDGAKLQIKALEPGKRYKLSVISSG